MEKALFGLLLLFTCHVSAQFYPAEMFFTDGATRKGFVEPPGAQAKNVKYKATESGGVETLTR